MAENGHIKMESDGLGLGIRFASTVGNGKQMEMTAGIPLDWDAAAINAVLDKIAAVMDRQAARYMLIDMEMDIKAEENRLQTNYSEIERQIKLYKAEFEASGKRGEWKPSPTQANHLDNVDKNIPLIQRTIAEKRQRFEAMKEKCR